MNDHHHEIVAVKQNDCTGTTPDMGETSSHSGDGFVVQNNGELIVIPYTKILYFYVTNRKVSVYQEDIDRPIIFYSALEKIEQLLSGDGFARCHRSILVNLSKVKKIGKNGVQLINGHTLPVGLKYAGSFKDQLMRRYDHILTARKITQNRSVK